LFFFLNQRTALTAACGATPDGPATCTTGACCTGAVSCKLGYRLGVCVTLLVTVVWSDSILVCCKPTVSAGVRICQVDSARELISVSIFAAIESKRLYTPAWYDVVRLVVGALPLRHDIASESDEDSSSTGASDFFFFCAGFFITFLARFAGG